MPNLRLAARLYTEDQWTFELRLHAKCRFTGKEVAVIHVTILRTESGYRSGQFSEMRRNITFLKFLLFTPAFRA
jgi:hypothetical protein